MNAATNRAIPNDALAVLSAGRCDGPRFFLAAAALDRKLYESTNKVLDALGGKWNRSAKAHVFGEDCEPLIEGAIESGSYAKPSDMGWFPTPPDLARRVVELAGVSLGMLVLEPSAGEGAIVREIERADGVAFWCELDPARAGKLSGVQVLIGDFLGLLPEPTYCRVVMNPPFAKRADIHHVLHARKFLKPGGRLVSIMSAGVAFRQDALTVAFREQCETIEALPDESFKESGTSVRTVVVTMGAAA